jgi:hypothetical protein
MMNKLQSFQMTRAMEIFDPGPDAWSGTSSDLINPGFSNDTSSDLINPGFSNDTSSKVMQPWSCTWSDTSSDLINPGHDALLHCHALFSLFQMSAPDNGFLHL